MLTLIQLSICAIGPPGTAGSWRQLRLQRSRRLHGFTLVELLVVIAIIGMLIAILLPAIQASREASRRASCLNNMKQLMLGFHNHLESKNAFPPSRINLSGQQRGWIVDLLPYLEGNSLAKIYKANKNFYDAGNAAVVTTPLPLSVCPSTPLSASDRIYPLTAAGGMPYNTYGAAADYSVAYLLNAFSAVSAGGTYTSESLIPVLYAGATEDNQLHPVVRISDGMSQTVLICEQAGRPDHYVRGLKQAKNDKLTFPNWWMAWASQRVFTYQGYDLNGFDVGAACAINCNNSQGIYSFHPHGANTSFCDGSVRFLNSSISVKVMFALLTRQAGETDPE